MAKGKKNKEQRIKDLKEIAIVIDSWDDVFSDFDPRPLSERTVSGDFAEELKKRYRETRAGDFVITIYAPIALKDESSEQMVAEHLRKHFHYLSLQKQKAIKRIRMRGAIFVCVGISSLSFLTLATYFKFLSTIAIEIAAIVLMPLGWFGFWEGLSKLVDTSPAFLQDEIFFDKLSKTTYQFKYVEDED
ncbi:MAG: hypothetical protein JW869_00540 [Candidatus Omnitrophica bacterium]|nr:hypothetical protein [Candidatus Omnitrophota bacterium]